VYLLRLLLWLGVSVQYLGFAGVMGILLRRAWLASKSPWKIELAAAYGLFLFLPASILVIGLPEWSLWNQVSTLVTGLCVVWLGTTQPSWIPKTIWGRTFGQRFFAGSMALAALWGVGLMLSTQTLAPILVTSGASMAGIASLRALPRSI
jgi:hypothetical protein